MYTCQELGKPFGHCATRMRCENQRIQRSVNADLALRLVAGKGVSLVADAPITEDEFVVQYVGEVLNRKAYHERELKVLASC
ncbi:hypothetical protein GQ600_8704 [Phytophthora cactorum]|nr:hypothetical protein GQ600_8704 [Phytophthora cactorum]